MRYLLRSCAILFNSARRVSMQKLNDESLLSNAKIAAMSGQLEKAEELYWLALKLNPKNEIVYHQIFNIWAKKGSALGFHHSEKMQMLKVMYNKHIKDLSADLKKGA